MTQPRRVVSFGQPLVLFRTPEGRLSAWLDRCPHRNAPLSEGRCDSAGRLECPYHGWQFDADGRCVEIPGLARPLTKEYQAQTLSVREEQGLVWVVPDLHAGPPPPLPYRSPHAGDPTYTTVVREVVAPGGLEAVAENALDVPHTAVLHRGLFRGGSRQRIRAVVRRYRDRVETEYIGEKPPTGLVARVLSWQGDRDLSVQHFDRFFAPNVLQVEYRLGERTHFVITGYLSPEEAHRTRLFAVASFRTPLPGKLLALALEPLGRLVFAQDQAVLAKQSEVIRAFGQERFVSTELDTMGPVIHRLLKERRRSYAGGAGPGPAGGRIGLPLARLPLADREPVQVSELELDA